MIPTLLAAIACCLWAGIVSDQKTPLVFAWKIFFLPLSVLAILIAALASFVIEVCTAFTRRLDITMEEL